MDSAHQLGRRIHEQIEAEFPGALIIGGVSGPARALADWPTTYQQALQAMQLGQRLKLTNQFVEFTSLGIYRLLYGLENQPDVRHFAEEIMRPLAEYDQQNRGSLVKTVEAYFSHHGNISQTAESLFVHRNTLLYRMERIQELTQLQLDQANMRLALHLALKLWQLRPESEGEPNNLHVVKSIQPAYRLYSAKLTVYSHPALPYTLRRLALECAVQWEIVGTERNGSS
jgi:purine catabolism regulator